MDEKARTFSIQQRRNESAITGDLPEVKCQRLFLWARGESLETGGPACKYGALVPVGADATATRCGRFRSSNTYGLRESPELPLMARRLG